MGYDYGAATTLQALARVAREGPAGGLRDLAVARLSYQAAPGFGYSAVPDDQKPAWRAFFRERLGEVTSARRLIAVWRGVRGLADESALPDVAARLGDVPLGAADQRAIICQAHAFAGAEAWAAFKAALVGLTSLSARARTALEDPSTCSS
jgi:hypothetical protein